MHEQTTSENLMGRVMTGMGDAVDIKLRQNYRELTVYLREEYTFRGAEEATIQCNSIWAKAAKWLFDQTNYVAFFPTTDRAINYTTLQILDVAELVQSLLVEREFAMIRGEEVERILLGRELWRKVCRGELDQPATVNVAMAFVAHSHGPRMIHDVPVQFVPWIEGFVIVPKL